MENRYDKYKDSGIAWIGEIPEHWEIRKLKNIFLLSTGTTPKEYDKISEGDNLINWYTPSDILEGCNDLFSSLRKLSERVIYENKISLFPIGTLLYVGIGASAGKVGYANENGYSNQQITGLIPLECYSRFYFYYLSVLKDKIRDNAFFTTLPIINNVYLGQELLPYPLLSEQQSIATYLDQKCSKIDELITLQEEMITKLQNYKQSVITEAVTKGLDKNVPLKDSGIEWIGEIPEHWEVKRMKSIYNFGKGLNITKADLVDKGISVISYGQIHSKLNTGTCIKDSLIKYVPEIFLENNNASLVKKGDIIFADTSEDLEGCGNCIYIDRDMLLYAGYHTIIAKNISTYINRFFSYLFQTDCWRSQIRKMVNGVKLFSIPQKLLSSTDIITPSLSEQQSIADYLDQKCSEIDKLISIKQQKIEKLKDYKKSLIFECVTGKRKVS